VSPWLPAVLHRSSLRGTALCTRCRARRPSSQRRRRITCQSPEGSGSGWEVPGGGTGRRSCGLQLQCRRRGARTEGRCSPRRLGELVLVEVGIRVAECLDTTHIDLHADDVGLSPRGREMRAPVGIVLVVGSRAVYAPRTSDQSCGLCSIACRAGASTRPPETRSHWRLGHPAGQETRSTARARGTWGPVD
jgi:hypothetical protein